MNDFKVSFCHERITFTKKENSLYIPMVSFCDIPLSEVKNHVKRYGSYGIGLTKEWAIKSKLNPVLYIQEGSYFAENISSSINSYNRSIKSLSKAISIQPFMELDEEHKGFLDVLRYIKNYQADLKRKDKPPEKDYRFSDEREWRYVPNITEHIEGICFEAQYDEKRLTDSIKDYRLRFEPNDIKYVIVKDDNDIEEFLEVFHKEKGNKYTYSDIQRLSTRIITTEQIMNDF
ncbi:MAG: hypothetical protein GQ570_14225 [Helicobacteraceae bacterium]|nr:hypothetical protein [Helicobacteraceae bacterium]